MSTASPVREACPACGTAPRSSLLCEGCGTLLEPRGEPSPFEVLGLEPGFELDPAATRKRMLALARGLHPDFHSQASPQARRRAEDSTAALNAAYALLADDFRRADWLLEALGGPREDQERSMPPEFLQEVLEWNEAIEEARAAGARSPALLALEGLASRLAEERGARMQRVAALLTPLPAPGAPALRQTRQQLNALRYLDRALAEIGQLRLSTES